MSVSLQILFNWMGRSGISFFFFLLLFFAADRFAPPGGLRVLAGLALFASGLWFALRLLRKGIWRLRNRLYVTYVFIAIVPIVLVVGLAWIGGYVLITQLAVYLVTSELDRRIASLDRAAESLVRSSPADRPFVMRGMMELFYAEHNPGIEVLIRESGKLIRYPNQGTLPAPRKEWSDWKDTRGVLLRDGQYYLWSHRKTATGDVTVTAPVTADLLAGLVPKLGVVNILESRGEKFVTHQTVPKPANRFDVDVKMITDLPAALWDRPGAELQKEAEKPKIAIHSRISPVLSAVFNPAADAIQEDFRVAIVAVAIVFLVFEIISAMIGISMTRTITGAVHRLYEGTQKVMEGNFSHRIEVKGKDQLADLSQSFNRMTENLERLLVVAKEKERLQSEVEIAREVQSQLYPRVVPQTRSLRLTAVCHPARMCSGDYYDYEVIRDSQIALAIGDVAGKGISAALLMATLQSSLRSQLQSALEIAAAVGGRSSGSTAPFVSTSHLVSRLNNQLYAYTSPEKYATFCFGIFDEPSGIFTYTNAGHLPPLLVRDGAAERLDVNGTVVGAFPSAKYDESRVELKPGDLLVCFTDGITEPENEYGEMFGEDRLVDLIARHAHLNDEQIVEVVLEGVREWMATDELPDDMTILLARRV